jgi:hypothetical protein
MLERAHSAHVTSLNAFYTPFTRLLHASCTLLTAQHTRLQHPSAYVSIPSRMLTDALTRLLHASYSATHTPAASVSIRQHTAAAARMSSRCRMLTYAEHTPAASVSIRQHTQPYAHTCSRCRMLTYAERTPAAGGFVC